MGMGLAGASGLLALGMAPLGCSVDAGDGRDARNATSATASAALETGATSPAPADVRVGLGFHGAVPGSYVPYLVTHLASTGDEFIRPGDHVFFDLPSYLTMGKILGAGSYATTWEGLRDIHGSVEAIFLKGTERVASRVLPVGDWHGSQMSLAVASTEAIEVPAGADALTFRVTLTLASAPGRTAFIEPAEMAAAPIFGGVPSAKTALFDVAGGAAGAPAPLRSRLLDGPLVPSATLAVDYTNGRADAVADVATLDRKIGRARDQGRFGSFEHDLYGDLVHEISYVTFGADGTASPEVPLGETFDSRVLPQGQKDYEATLVVPASVDPLPMAVTLAFHVRTYLVVRYAGHDTTARLYEDGARLLVRDRWDTPSGPGTHYDFPVALGPS